MSVSKYFEDATETQEAIRDCRLLEKAYDTPTYKTKTEQVFIKQEDDCIVFAIAGSNQIRDWRNNLNKKQAPIYDFEVSEGFLFGAKAIQEDVLNVANATGMSIHLTGHSRGGAVASILAIILEKAGFTASLRTFGSPKWTKSQISSEVINNSVRYVTPGDLITMWPVRSGFKHLGNRILIGKDIDRHAGRFFDVYDSHMLSYYMIELYAKALDESQY